MLNINNKKALAYIIGVALGDGGLSNPNGRAVRLRITCDIKYPNVIQEIISALKIIAPDNKVSIAKTKSRAVDISCYSNQWPEILGWKVGSKLPQNVGVPNWIKINPKSTKECLRGLLQTDGSIYMDRKYLMVNFVNHGEKLAFDALSMIQSLGFNPTISIVDPAYGKRKYTLRIAKNVARFIKVIGLYKN